MLHNYIVPGDSAHKDALSKTCSFIQTTGLCCVGNSLFIVKTDSQSLSILASLQSIDQYLSMLRRIQRHYQIHFNVLGYYDTNVKDAIESLEFARTCLAKQVKMQKFFKV